MTRKRFLQTIAALAASVVAGFTPRVRPEYECPSCGPSGVTATLWRYQADDPKPRYKSRQYTCLSCNRQFGA